MLFINYRSEPTSFEELDGEERNSEAKYWISELTFVQEEQSFLNDLARFYTFELAHPALFDESKMVIDAILRSEREVVLLMDKVRSYQGVLKVSVTDDGGTYREAHKDLASEVREYLIGYGRLKTGLFRLVTKVMGAQKQKKLLN